MTDFSDIRAAFAKYSEAKQNFWNDLQAKAWRVYLGFEDHLGLKGVKFKSQSGIDQRYVQVGSMRGDEFTAVNAPLFGGENLQVLFTIQIVLDLEANTFPKTLYNMDLKIGKDGPQYKVSFLGADGWTEVPVAGSFEFPQLKALFELMAQDLLNRIDPAPYS